MLQGKIFELNDEVIDETNAYFEAKFFFLHIEILKKHWNECIALEEDYIYK